MAQMSSNAGVIKGELRCDDATLFNGYRVEMYVSESRGEVLRADVQLDGSFTVHDIRPGSYTLNVTTLAGDMVHQEIVPVLPHSGVLVVRIPARQKAAGEPGTVSVRQLLHPPDRKAFQALASAQRFSESNQPDKAAEELEKAIRISPDYADAYNNLAVQHMRLGKYEQACDELNKSLEIAGPQVKVLANLAFAQRHLRRYKEAAETATAALNLDKSNAPAHLVLGSIMAGNPATWSEGIKHLEIAAETLESAKATLAKARQLRAAK